jgi:hypothetical protein
LEPNPVAPAGKRFVHHIAEERTYSAGAWKLGVGKDKFELRPDFIRARLVVPGR